MESWLVTYGYIALGIGTFLEGETVLIAAGVMAHAGYLRLPLVMVVAFIGSLLGDQFFFWLGRYRGKSFLAKRPHWHDRVSRVQKLIHRHAMWVSLLFRFAYGFRALTPFLLGTTHLAFWRFLLLNILGAAVWSVIVAYGGYAFGATFKLILGDLEHYEHLALVFLLVAAGGFWIWRRQVRKNRRNRR